MVIGVMIVYLIVMLLIGVWSSRKIHEQKDFVLAGRALPPWIAGLSQASTAFSGYMFMAAPGLSYRLGYAASWFALGDAGGNLTAMAIVGRRIRRLSEILGCLTPMEIFEKRFNSPESRLAGALIVGVANIAYTTAQMVAFGTLFELLVNLPFAYGVILGFAIKIAYTLLGGYLAVSVTDFFQAIMMVVVVTYMFIASYLVVGGITGIHNAVYAIDPELLSIFGPDRAVPWGVGIAWLILALTYGIGAPHIAIRQMSIDKAENIKSAILYQLGWACIVGVVCYLFGLPVLAYFGAGLENPEIGMIMMAQEILPLFLFAIFSAGIVAAIMSTGDSLLTMCSSTLSRDVYQRFVNPKADERRMIMVNRFFILVIALLALIFALYEPPLIFTLVVFALGVQVCAFIWPILGAIYFKWFTRQAVLASIISGGLVYIITTIIDLGATTGIDPFLWGMGISGIIAFSVSKFTQPPNAKLLEVVDLVNSYAPVFEDSAYSNQTLIESKAISEKVSWVTLSSLANSKS